MKTLFYSVSLALAASAAPAFALTATTPAATTPATAGPTPAARTAAYAPISVAEVQAAQRAWCDALVAISQEHEKKGLPAAKALAGQVLDSAYAYDMGPVLFKPTLTVAPQTFRKARAGALAYFVGDDRTFAQDTGFALRNWRKCESQNPTVLLTGNSALSMGNVAMWDAKGAMTTVDKTWGYVRGPEGNLKIVLHHSSLPYTVK